MLDKKKLLSMVTLPLLIHIILLVSFQEFSFARDTINSTHFLKDGDTIVSSGEIFEMGFFSPTSSQNRYLGIWYNQIPDCTVVWVANRDTPLTNTSSVVLKIVNPCWLALVDGNGADIWHTNTSRLISNPVAKLLDSGNLVVMDANDDSPENFLWQSFDHPTDTQLPGMKLGRNFVTGLDTTISAWKSEDNPGMGEYKLSLDLVGYPQLILRKGRKEVFRSGPWNGLGWSGSPGMVKKGHVGKTFLIISMNEISTHYQVYNSSNLVRTVLSNSGILEVYIWDGTGEWNSLRKMPADVCDEYRLCGVYGSCDYNRNGVCGCLDKFMPRDPGAWGRADYSRGCVQRTPLNCKNGSSNGFLKYSGIKLPDTEFSTFNSSMNLQECEQVCLKNCSCMAYSSLDISNGENGCLLWFGDLFDIRVLPVGGQHLYIRIASSYLDYPSSSKGKKSKIIKLSSSVVLVGILVLSLTLTLIIILYKRRRKETHLKLKWEEDQISFEISTITRATHNFSLENKIEEGGYGPVYKKISFARNTVSSTEILKYGDTIVSSGGIFEMGFFSPINSQNIYVGIWYKNIPIRTVVWVANRDTPLSNTSSVALQIISPGWLALVDGNGTDIWHTNTSRQVQNPVAKLLDSGNLVVIDANDDIPESFLWQSFDHPTDTHLPGMKLGKNFVTGCPQLILRKGGQEVNRWGPWNGLRWSGLPGMIKRTETSEMFVIMNTNEVSFSYNSSTLIRTVLSNDGTVKIYMWSDGRREWNNIRKIPTDVCDEYRLCGAYESCDFNNNPICGCLDKFLPRDPRAWGRRDYSGGCVRRTPLECQNTSSDGFVKYSGVKLPDTEFSWFNSSMNLQECEQVCFNNCSCMAYSSLDISNGQNGCLLWFGDLIDIKVLPVDGQDLYIRMASSDLDYPSTSKGKKSKIIKLTSSILVGVLLGLSMSSTLGVLDDGKEIAVKRLSKTSKQGLGEF
nr:G-type lectin S-receptor-like serine/threonine-protein kinase At4g27290 isoform X2 [Ipomoea batatas]